MCFAHFLHVMNAIQDSGSSFWFFFFAAYMKIPATSCPCFGMAQIFKQSSRDREKKKKRKKNLC